MDIIQKETKPSKTNSIKLKKLNKCKYLILNTNNNSNKSKKINITLNNVYLKFGIEKYNSNYILNIFANKNDTNDNYNKLVRIINIASKIKKINENTIKATKYNILNKEYKSPVIDNKFDKDVIIIRTYLSHNCNINIANIFMPLDKSTDMSNYYANVNITVHTMWVTESTYGVTIYTNNIYLLHKKIDNNNNKEICN